MQHGQTPPGPEHRATPPMTPAPNPWDNYYAHQHDLHNAVTQKKRRKTSLWVSIVAFPLAVVVGFILVKAIGNTSENTAKKGTTVGEQDLGSGSPTDPLNWAVNIPAGPIKTYATDVPGLTLGSSLNENELAAADPRSLYWAMLKRQGIKPVTDYVQIRWASLRDYQGRFSAGTANRYGADYRTRKFIDESTDIEKDGSPSNRSLTRCVDGGREAIYRYEDKTFNLPAEWKFAATPGFCDDRMQPRRLTANAFMSDSIAPGGLSPENMDKFISFLDQIPNLFTVEKPTKVVDKNGKEYIQLDVKLLQQDAKLAGSGLDRRLGIGFLNAAFGQTGINPMDHPYSIDGNATEGKQIRYFIDPATLLPSRSAMMSLKPLNLDGSPAAIEAGEFRNEYTIYQYSFPDQLDPAATKAEGIPHTTFTPWPFEQVIFQ